jgi:hypothetical protein
VADWTLVAAAAVTGATGVLGGWVGYLSARHQSAGELERLREQHAVEARRYRQEEYRRFLDHLSSFMAIEAGEVMIEDSFSEWQDEFHHLANGIRLFGEEEVVTHVVELAGALGVILSLIPDEEDWGGPPGEYPPFEDHLLRAWGTVAQGWGETFRHLVAAMRADVLRDEVP